MKVLFLTLSLLATTANAAPFSEGHAEKGKMLFNKYDCSSCHQAKMGGDGSAIFTRHNHKVRQPSDLIPQIKFCSGMIGAKLGDQENEDLAAYLNETYYKFK